MPPDWVLMFPSEAKLKIMPRNSFVNGDWPRIHRRRAPKVTKLFRRLRHVPDAVFLQARRPGEIVSLSESKNAQIFRREAQGVMLYPIGDTENAALRQKFPDRQFLCRRILDPVIEVVGDFERRHLLVPILL